MTMHLRLLSLAAALVAALGLGVAGWADDDDAPALPFDEVDFFFELNETDGDLGVQLVLDGEPWKRLRIFDPWGKKLLDLKGKGNLKEFGLASLFFESNEPGFDEVSKQDILALFPEGEYTFTGRTVEGDLLAGSAMLTHDLPDGPVILGPEDGDVVDPADVVVSWSPVTTPAEIEITSYQVIVTNDEDPRFVYDVRLPPVATSLPVPAEFFAPDTEYELEVLAVEESGNQTISLLFFTTEE